MAPQFWVKLYKTDDESFALCNCMMQQIYFKQIDDTFFGIV